MSFNRDNFAYGSQAQGSNAPKIHSYGTTTDNKAAVIASGYFNDINKTLRAGDFIMTSASDGDMVVAVAAVTSGVVTVTSVALA